MTTPLRIGISACLTGQAVRYDGTDKRQPGLLQRLASKAELVPLCPEVAIGLGVPRPPIHLLDTGGAIRAIGVEDASLDVTDRLTQYAASIGRRQPPLHGIILKARSPSCGLHTVEITGSHGQRLANGRGLFAATLLAAAPALPAAEEGELSGAQALDGFVQRCIEYRLRLQMTESAN